MSVPAPDPLLDYLPRWPRRKDFRIGCIGAGFIMRDCHLVAYRQAGFNPVAIWSRDPAHARAVAEQHKIDRVHEPLDDLLADKRIEVLDIAVPPDAQPGIIRRAVRHGRFRLREIEERLVAFVPLPDEFDRFQRDPGEIPRRDPSGADSPETGLRVRDPRQ